MLEVSFTDAAAFTVSVNGTLWLSSAPINLFADGAWQNLTWHGVTHSKGHDSFGSFSSINVTWSWSHAELLHTAVQVYEGQDTAVFVQQLPRGAVNTNASNPVLPGGLRVMDPGDYPPIVSFPSFTGGRLESLGYLTWQSRMVNAEWGTNVTNGPHATNEPLSEANPAGRGLQGLSTSGPVAVFDASSGCLVVAPMDNFKNAVHYSRDNTTWETGVSSEVRQLPPNFEHRTILVAGRGITATLDAWGTAFRQAHGTNRTGTKWDPNVNYLSW